MAVPISENFEEYITITEAARLGKTSRPTIYRLIMEGSLRAIAFTPNWRPGKSHNWRIPLSAWREFLENGGSSRMTYPPKK